MKLDPELMEEWELSLGVSTDPPPPPPSYAELDRFMKAQIRALDAARLTKQATAPESKAAKSSRSSVARVGTTNPEPDPSSYEVAADKRVCFNCLAPGHMAPSCPVTATCSRCSRQHHSLLKCIL